MFFFCVRALHIADENPERFWSDLYQTSILGIAVLIPLVLAPPAILVASVRLFLLKPWTK